MGAAQSTPSQIEGGQFPTIPPPPRNKLTKPRTNSNNTREASCLPSLPLSLSRSSLHGSSKPSSAVNYQTIIEDQSSGAIFAIEYSQTAPSIATSRQPGKWDRSGDHASDNPPLYSTSAVNSALPLALSPSLVSNGTPRRGSMPTRSSTNSSSVRAPGRTSDITSMGTVRRRSQILAAPPATATRKPTKSRRNSMDVSDISLDPLTLAPELEYDLGRCNTPSGYSVLGAFKRGSLRIANGAASPAPSSCAGSPDTSARIDYIGSTLVVPEVGSSRPPSRVKPIIIVPYSVHEVRLVPPSPTDWGRVDEEEVPGSPFSFMRSPSIYDDDTLDLPVECNQIADFAQEGSGLPIDGPTDSCENVVSPASSTIYTGSRAPVGQCPNQHSTCVKADSPQTAPPVPSAETNESHNNLHGEPQKDDRCLRQASMTKAGGEGTDSGYSSSGSANSWKSDQPTEPNPIARKLGNPRPAAKVNSMPLLGGAGMAEESDKRSRTRSVIAAIRRRYSQGDLKASARSMEFAKSPPVPAVPALEHKKTLTKFRPELKHRRSMVAVVKSPTKTAGIRKPSPAIAPVPPLPCPSKLERRGSFNLLALEDYLPLVEDIPFTPIIDHAPKTFNISSASIETSARESVIKIGVGRALYGGSKITGQDYYQRFSRKQYAAVETLVG